MLANHDQYNKFRFKLAQSLFVIVWNRAECKNLLCKIAKLDRSKVRLDQSRIVSAEFELSPNSNSSPLRIRVLDLILLVYNGNSKHVFKNAFRERLECILCLFFVYLGFCTQKLSKVFVELYVESFVRFRGVYHHTHT